MDNLHVTAERFVNRVLHHSTGATKYGLSAVGLHKNPFFLWKEACANGKVAMVIFRCVVRVLFCVVAEHAYLSILAWTLCVPDLVQASEGHSIEYTICSVVDALSGNIARSLAAIAVIFLGFSLFLGKISWGIALALAIGIGTVFGAPEIVSVLAGDGKGCETVLSDRVRGSPSAEDAGITALGGGGADTSGLKASSGSAEGLIGSSSDIRPLEGQTALPGNVTGGAVLNAPDGINTNDLQSPDSASVPNELPSGTYVPAPTDVPTLYYPDASSPPASVVLDPDPVKKYDFEADPL